MKVYRINPDFHTVYHTQELQQDAIWEQLFSLRSEESKKKLMRWIERSAEIVEQQMIVEELNRIGAL